MISVEKVWKSYGGRPVLQGAAFSLARGQRLALVGPNGSGKTTLMRCLLGLVAYEGKISVDGLDPLREHAQTQRLVAYVPQRAPALPVPVGELVAFWAAVRKRDREQLITSAELLGLGVVSIYNQPFPSLSGGMQQKLLAAMALASDCPVLLLDEPTANLDPQARAAFFSALSEKSPAPTLILSSHRLEEIRRLVDRVLVLREGRVAFDDPLESFLANASLAAEAGLDELPSPRVASRSNG